MHRLAPSLILLSVILAAAAARADIFQWEYINPADPSQGKQQSTTLCIDGAGVNAMPGADLSYRYLPMAYLDGADLMNAIGERTNLTKASFVGANLSGAHITYDGGGDIWEETSLGDADLSQANLSDATFDGARLTNADLTGAHIRGASFRLFYDSFRVWVRYGGLTLAQLYSTASYQTYDLAGINLGGNDLTGGNFAHQNLTNSRFVGFYEDYYYSPPATLIGADFTAADVQGANFNGATLTDADFSGAEIRGANFGTYSGNGITLAQLYSTASYQAHDLSGIGLRGNNLAGANFSGFNLTGANLDYANLTGADFTNAEVRGASLSTITLAQLYSTASYAAHDLSGIRLSSNNFAGANFAGHNLADASFFHTNLAGADLSRANLSDASFSILGWPSEGPNLSGADLSQANLSNAYFVEANLSGADLSQANLTNTTFENFFYGTFAGADFTGADLRGAHNDGGLFFGHIDYLDYTATTTNLIRPNGHIDGLDLDARGLLVVRDYDGKYAGPIPITVDQHLAMGPGGTLRMVFEADAWDSTISFAPGIPVTLGGTLELTFANDVNLASQVGRTFDLFDWTGVTPTGAFAVSSPYAWDLSNLYTTGQVTLTAVPEPTSLILMIPAVFGWSLRRRRAA